MSIGRILRIAAAAAILVGGLVHLDLYFDGYRAIPDIGRSFLLNAIASGLIATAVAARQEWFVRFAGIGVAVGTIVAFILSRQGDGLFDFREQGFNPAPQAGLALFVEITAIVLLGLTFIPTLSKNNASFTLPAFAATAAVAAIVMIAFGISAARDDGSSDASAPSLASSDSAPAATVAPADTATTVAGQTTVPGDTTTTVAGAAAPSAGAQAIEIKDFSFQAPSLAVAKGSTVTWVNDDGVGHSVNASDGSFDSERLDQGATFEFTFDADGEFAYVCNIHPYMHGTITVTG